MTLTLAIFDYGAGNIFSLKNSLEREEGAAKVHVISDFEDHTLRDDCDGLLLPGVGNFDPAMKAVTRHSQDGFARYVRDKMPVLGICLGMEMFFSASQEGREPGLAIMRGKVVGLPDTLKVPHMGWNSLQIRDSGSRLLEGVADGSWVYFVHSYMAFLSGNNGKDTACSFDECDMPQQQPQQQITHDCTVTAESNYNDLVIPAAVEYGNYFGTQFHPEKSGPVGRQMIRNFLGVCRR